MEKVTYKYWVSIGYANANQEEEVEYEFEESDTQEERDAIVEQDYQVWLYNILETGFYPKSNED